MKTIWRHLNAFVIERFQGEQKIEQMFGTFDAVNTSYRYLISRHSAHSIKRVAIVLFTFTHSCILYNGILLSFIVMNEISIRKFHSYLLRKGGKASKSTICFFPQHFRNNEPAKAAGFYVIQKCEWMRANWDR